jgi:hypothetical protein
VNGVLYDWVEAVSAAALELTDCSGKHRKVSSGCSELAAWTHTHTHTHTHSHSLSLSLSLSHTHTNLVRQAAPEGAPINFVVGVGHLELFPDGYFV